jgi:hypothetical protein
LIITWGLKKNQTEMHKGKHGVGVKLSGSALPERVLDPGFDPQYYEIYILPIDYYSDKSVDFLKYI